MSKIITLDYADHAAAVALYDEAFQHPRKRYLVRPVDVAVAQAWIRENASMLHFDWVDPRPPMRLGDLISLDTLYYRNRCGWQGDDYTCECPSDEHSATDEDDIRLCFKWNCPVAYEASLDDLRRKDKDLYRQYKDEKSVVKYGDSCGDWMVLNARPRYAAVPNVVVIGIDIPEPPRAHVAPKEARP